MRSGSAGRTGRRRHLLGFSRLERLERLRGQTPARNLWEGARRGEVFLVLVKVGELLLAICSAGRGFIRTLHYRHKGRSPYFGVIAGAQVLLWRLVVCMWLGLLALAADPASLQEQDVASSARAGIYAEALSDKLLDESIRFYDLACWQTKCLQEATACVDQSHECAQKFLQGA